jgi:hypothetical protein
MRDPNRIPHVLRLIGELWTKYPQLRLGQLLVNVDKRFETNPFYIEDDEVEAALRKVADKGFFSS